MAHGCDVRLSDTAIFLKCCCKNGFIFYIMSHSQTGTFESVWLLQLRSDDSSGRAESPPAALEAKLPHGFTPLLHFPQQLRWKQRKSWEGVGRVSLCNVVVWSMWRCEWAPALLLSYTHTHTPLSLWLYDTCKQSLVPTIFSCAVLASLSLNFFSSCRSSR